MKNFVFTQNITEKDGEDHGSTIPKFNITSVA